MRLTIESACRRLCVLALALLLTLPSALRAQASFIRADANGTGEIDISDAVFTLSRLFLSGEPFPCDDAADSNDDGEIDISDAILGLVYQFLGGVPPRPPFPDCGLDPTPGDSLGCERSPLVGCSAPPSPSPIVKFLQAISLDGTEPCCLSGLGVHAVRYGTCESLGGTLAGDVLATGPPCSEPAAPAPALQWRRMPPVTAVDPFFAVEVAPLNGIQFDYLTLDLYSVQEDGSLVGPSRVESSNLNRAGSGSGWVVNAGVLAKGDYTLVATAWRQSDVAPDGTINTLSDVPVFVLGLPGGFRAHPTAAETLSLVELAELARHSPAFDPAMDALLDGVQAAEMDLMAVQASLHSPLIDGTRNQIRGIEAERGREQDVAADSRRQADAAEGRAAQLRAELGLLVLVNRYLDTYFGPEDLKAIKDLIKRREDILAGAAQDDRQALQDALDKKKARLDEVNKELADKKAKLDQLKKDHEAMKKAIREQFHKTRRTLGDNLGHFEITDSSVTYDISGILVTNSGKGYILYAPYGDAYKAEKAKLDEMIKSYEDNWKAIQDCEKEIADLEKEKAWLEGNIAKLESGAQEVDEIDSVLDGYFRVIAGAAIHAPHMAALIAALRAAGYGWLAVMLEDLFGSVPKTCEELEEFEKKLQALRDAKHAKEAEIQDEIRRAEAEAAEAKRRQEEAERRQRELEEEARAAEERLRQAEEEARRKAEEEYRRQQAAAEEEARRRAAQAELEERIQKLRERAQQGDEDAIRELVELLGLTLLDELLDDLPLGTMIGGLITLANIPDCLCEILEAMLALFADRGEFRLVLANEVIRLFRECAGLPGISSIELGASQLADAVDRMSPQARRRVCEALRRAIALHCD